MQGGLVTAFLLALAVRGALGDEHCGEHGALDPATGKCRCDGAWPGPGEEGWTGRLGGAGHGLAARSAGKYLGQPPAAHSAFTQPCTSRRRPAATRQPPAAPLPSQPATHPPPSRPLPRLPLLPLQGGTARCRWRAQRRGRR